MTTLSESFTASNGALTTADLTWVLPVSQQAITNDWQVYTNKARLNVGAGFCPALCTSALATDDYEVSVTVAGTPTYSLILAMGLIGRKATTGTTAPDCDYYYFIYERYDANASGQRCWWEIGKVVDNTRTALGSPVYLADGTMPASGKILKFRLEGSTLTGFYDGSQVIQVTGETTMPTGKYAGIIGAEWDFPSDLFDFDTWGASDYVAAASTYFVKTGGSDSADGLSDGTAWATISKVNATTLNPGDTVQFNGGDTFSGNLAPTISGGGSAASPVTFTSYGTGKATLTSSSGHGLRISATSGIEVSYLIVRSTDTLPSTTTYGDGIRVDLTGAVTTARSHFYVDGCEVYNFSYAGIACWGGCTTSGAGWDDVQITNCHVEGNQAQGIIVCNTESDVHGPDMTNCYVADCVAVSNPGTGGTAGIPDLQGNGILGYGWSGGTIERCYVSDNATDSSGAQGGGVGAWFRTCTNSVLQFCEGDANGVGAATDGSAFSTDIGCSGCILQYNYSHDNRNGISAYSGGGTVIRYNIIENDGQDESDAARAAGIQIFTCPNSLVYGNTVWVTPGAVAVTAVSLHNTSTGCKVLNNVLITSGASERVLYVAGDSVTDTVINGNAYWQIGDTTTFRAYWNGSTYTSLAAFRTGSSQETGTGYNVDPLLVAPGTGGTIGAPTTATTLRNGLTMYRPASGSWVQGAGLDLDTYSITSPGTVDFFGVTLPTSGATTLGASLSAAVATDDLVLLLAGHSEARA